MKIGIGLDVSEHLHIPQFTAHRLFLTLSSQLASIMSSDGSDYMSDLQASSDTESPSSNWLIKYPHLDHNPWEVADSPDAPRIRPKKASDWSTLSSKDIAIIEEQQLHRNDCFLDEEAFLKLYTSDSINPFQNMANVPVHVYEAIRCHSPLPQIAPHEVQIVGTFGTRKMTMLKAQYQGKDVLIKPVSSSPFC